MSGDPGSQDYLLGNFLVNLGAGARDPANHRNKRVAISPGTGASTGTAVAARPSGQGRERLPPSDIPPGRHLRVTPPAAGVRTVSQVPVPGRPRGPPSASRDGKPAEEMINGAAVP